MKSLLLIPLLALAPLPSLADSQRGYSNQCFEEVYREEYIPGTRQNPGRIRSWTENVEVPCNYPPVTETRPIHREPVDDNSCVEGSILGGILGGGIGGAISQDEGRWVAVPIGIATGAMVGCQIDGG